MEKPLLIFEKFALKIKLRKTILFPIPVIILYLVLSLMPDMLLHENLKNIFQDGKWNFSSRLVWNINWFILTCYSLYMVLWYKTKYFQIISDFKRKNLIDEEIFEKAKSAFVDRRVFVIFLIFFEVLFYQWWPTPSGFFQDIPGIFIAFIVLPIGAEIFSSFSAGVRLPRILSKEFHVDLFDSDGRGGLKSTADLLLVLSTIYFLGIAIIIFLYPPFFMSISGIPFIIFGMMLFFLPQFFVHRLLLKEKNQTLEIIDEKYTDYLRKIEENHFQRNSINSVDFEESDVSNLKLLRDEIRSVQTWPYDINIIRKFVVIFVPFTIEWLGLNIYKEPIDLILQFIE